MHTPDDKARLFAEHWRAPASRVNGSRQIPHPPPPPRPWPLPGDGDRLATASFITALVSLVAWPLGFAALWLAWKATRHGMGLYWPAAAYAIAGGALGLVTAGFTTGIAAAVISSALR